MTNMSGPFAQRSSAVHGGPEITLGPCWPCSGMRESLSEQPMGRASCVLGNQVF
jgi:hypothetical protein